MADIDTYVKVAGVAAPLTKILIDTFITPKLKTLAVQWKRSNKLIDHSFENKLADYLINSYKKYSILNTIIFNNQGRLLKELYVPLEVISGADSAAKFIIDDYNDSFLPVYKKVLITDTAGMGKSTILKRMFLSIIDESKGIPILIELRRLSQEKGIVEEIIEQIKAINEEVRKEFVLDLINRGDFIFLLDGFDEIPIDRRQQVTNEVQSFISKASNNLFILTSRPEGALLSFGDFEEFSVRPLKQDEAFLLLRKYDRTHTLSPLLIKKIQELSLHNIQEFLTNPLLVSLLYTAFEHKQTIPFKKHIFYRQVYDALFESHDLTKGDSFIRPKFSSLDIDDFHKVLRYLGYVCLTKDKIEFTKDEILTILKEAKLFVVGFTFKESDFLKDLVNTVPLFTIDGIYYKWAHKSLQEYFAAQFIYLDAKERQKEILTKLSGHEDNQRFLNLFDLYYSIDYKSFKETIIYKLLLDYREYIKESYCTIFLPHKIDRQKLTFVYECIFIRFKFERDDKAPRKMFELLPIEVKKRKRGWSVNIVEVAEEKRTNHIKVPFITKPTHTILYFLKDKNENFVINLTIKSDKKNLKIDLPFHQPFPVDDNIDSILNTPENFKKVNDILLNTIRDQYLTIDDNKVDGLISEIESEFISKDKTDFLLNF